MHETYGNRAHVHHVYSQVALPLDQADSINIKPSHNKSGLGGGLYELESVHTNSINIRLDIKRGGSGGESRRPQYWVKWTDQIPSLIPGR